MFGKVFRHVKFAFLLCLAGLLCSQAQAIGMGEIQLNTSLNEPLNAEIQLLQVQGLNENEILVGIAPKADFEAAGVDRLFFLSSLKFSLELNNPKGPLIRIKTDAPVREPYLNFLLEVQWPNGRLLREYTLLMDLPAFADSHATGRTIKGTQAPVVSEKPKPAPLDVKALEAELAAVDATTVTATPAIAPAKAPAVQTSTASNDQGTTKAQSADATLQEEKPSAAAEQSKPEEAASDEAKPAYQPKPEEAPAPAAALEAAPQAATAPVYQSVVPVYSSTPQDGAYTTQKGDKLWSIAMKYRQAEGVTVQQSMMAIQRLNPDAFMKGNINLLKKGKVLRLPTYDDLTDITSREAVSEVRRQNVEWSGDPDGRKGAATAEQVDATHQDVAAAEAPVNAEEGHLKLSVPGAADGSAAGKASGAEAGSVEALQNELSISMEELDRNKREKANVNTQITSLDDQTKTMKQMLEVRSAELAALQASLAKKDEKATPPADQQGEVSDKTVLSEQAVEQAIEVEKAPAKVEAQTPPPAVTAPEVAAEVPVQGGIIDQLKANLVAIAGGVLTLLVLVFAVIKLRNRKPALDSALLEEDTHAAARDDLLEDEATLDDLDDVVGSLEESLESQGDEFEEAPVDAKPETSDALGEADIYISFGTYDKAESLLKNAIASEPKRTDLRLKLLEVYVGMDDVNAFDKQLAELSNLRDAGAIERAHEMRNKISGAAPLQAPAAAPADEALDFDLDLADDEPALDLSTDLDLGFDTEEPVAKADNDLDLDFDLDLDLDEVPAEKEDPTARSPKVSISDAPTVQQRALDISEMQTAVSPAVSVSEARTESREIIDLDMSDLDAELSEFDAEPDHTAMVEAVAKDAPTPSTGLDEEFDFLADADEAATKLDLAKAYIDMGDKEGAKDILQEVIEEGQEAQKNEARKLLEGIS